MKYLTGNLIDAAAEAFSMASPVYEFGFSPAPASARPAAGGGHGDEPARVDRLENLESLPFDDRAARTVVCENALQFVFEPHRAVAEMTRILAPGGLLVVAESTRYARPGGERFWTLHPGAVGRLLEPFAGSLIGWIGPDAAPHTVFGVACRAPMPAAFPGGVQPFLDRLGRALDDSADRVGVLRSIKRSLVGWMCSPHEMRAWQDDHRVQYALHLGVDQRSRPAILESCLPPSQPGTRLDLSE